MRCNTIYQNEWQHKRSINESKLNANQILDKTELTKI